MTHDLSVILGRKFDRDHQHAILLTRHLGVDGAKRACRRNAWPGVLDALEEQLSIVTIPGDMGSS